MIRITAAEAEDAQRRAAGWIRSAGLGVGARLGLIADGSPTYLAVVGAALRTGVIPVPIPETAPAEDRDYVVTDSAIDLLVGPSGWQAIETADAYDIASVPLTRPMLYTSGTTGRRKGVWAGVWDEERARHAYLDEHDHWGFEPNDLHLVCSPLYHSAPLRFALHTLLAGGDVLLQRHFDPAATLTALRSGGVSTSFMVPAHLSKIVGKIPGPTPRLRWLAHAGAPCPESLKREVLARLGPTRVVEFYGSTESQFTSCRGDEWLERPGTVGRARRGRRLWIDPQDSTIWCDQPSFAGFEYWGAPEKTAAAWRGASCSVGDLGRLDDSGYLYMCGRRDDLIVSGGVNVYPAEVERVFIGLAGIDNCVAYGRPDERWGQAVEIAFTGDVAEAILEAHAIDHLSPAARPKRYRRLDALPVGPTGKVSRQRLATSHED